MSETPFEARLRALGLRLSPEDAKRMEATVAAMESALQVVRVPRPAAEEPLVAFRLPWPRQG
ncbi:hypothetical protein LPC08_22830 [Roseomonas sp. OT10]|uniref:hypothetical protein n=1 Tax=Roseomonas cutis TaxID=2897332 RepID=UPI001E6091BF|nr:hypothetical protein [Roseomonas sp. OT10]UFN48803.1 hypothetical protein LPC08_22830 [Roseomonas sp. OT10]